MNISKENKNLIIASVVVIIVILILRIIMKKKGNQESGFVQPRGFFPGAGGTTPAGGAIGGVSMPPPAPMPPPTPTPTPTPTPPDGGGAGGRTGGGGTMGGGGTPPPPFPCGGAGQPPCPPPPPYPYGGYGYGGYPIYYYDPFPRTYIVDQTDQAETAKEDCYKRVMLNTEAGPKDACLNKTQYIEYLRNRIRGLEIAYDEAMSDLMLNVAFRVNKQLKRAKKELARELMY